MAKSDTGGLKREREPLGKGAEEQEQGGERIEDFN
jgi:hypothetical protein